MEVPYRTPLGKYRMLFIKLSVANNTSIFTTATTTETLKTNEKCNTSSQPRQPPHKANDPRKTQCATCLIASASHTNSPRIQRATTRLDLPKCGVSRSTLVQQLYERERQTLPHGCHWRPRCGMQAGGLAFELHDEILLMVLSSKTRRYATRHTLR